MNESFSGLYSVPLIYVSVLLLVPHCLDYWRFKVPKSGSESSIFVLFQNCSGSCNSLPFHYTLETVCRHLQKYSGGFNFNCVHLYISEELMLTVLSPSTGIHSIYLHLFRSSLNSFIRVLQVFSLQMLCLFFWGG